MLSPTQSTQHHKKLSQQMNSSQDDQQQQNQESPSDLESVFTKMQKTLSVEEKNQLMLERFQQQTKERQLNMLQAPINNNDQQATVIPHPQRQHTHHHHNSSNTNNIKTQLSSPITESNQTKQTKKYSKSQISQPNLDYPQQFEETSSPITEQTPPPQRIYCSPTRMHTQSKDNNTMPISKYQQFQNLLQKAPQSQSVLKNTQSQLQQPQQFQLFKQKQSQLRSPQMTENGINPLLPMKDARINIGYQQQQSQYQGNSNSQEKQQYYFKKEKNRNNQSNGGNSSINNNNSNNIFSQMSILPIEKIQQRQMEKRRLEQLQDQSYREDKKRPSRMNRSMPYEQLNNIIEDQQQFKQQQQHNQQPYLQPNQSLLPPLAQSLSPYKHKKHQSTQQQYQQQLPLQLDSPNHRIPTENPQFYNNNPPPPPEYLYQDRMTQSQLPETSNSYYYSNMLDPRIRESEQQLDYIYRQGRDSSQKSAYNNGHSQFNQRQYPQRYSEDEFKTAMIKQNDRLYQLLDQMQKNHQQEISLLKRRENQTLRLINKQQQQIDQQSKQMMYRDLPQPMQIPQPMNFFLPPFSY